LGIIVVSARSVRRARRQRASSREGFIVTWDVDSRDAGQCARVRRFVFGYTLQPGERRYRYPGFLEKEGVRYLGQSVLFVPGALLPDLLAFLEGQRVERVVTPASLGAVMPG
jgi:hypothetical protein